MATRVYDLSAADFPTELRALALRYWAEGTVFARAREPKGVGRADALARHVAHLAAMGESSAVLRGTISAVRMAKKLQFLRPGRALSTGLSQLGRVYNSEPSQHVWGTLGRLRAMPTALRTETDVAVLALAVFSACHSLRVGEARAAISHPGWISFYDRKTKRRWIPAT